MLFLRRASLLFASLLLASAAHAQTPLGQPTLDEQKVQIWCATVKFVYEDTGRPGLKNTLKCGGSLKELANSIQADSQRVYSALYQPLEGRGTMYNGLGSNPSRLQKLTTEIISRLKASPARRASPSRMQNVATLETALKSYVESGTPIGNLATAEATAEAADTTAQYDEAAAAPADAGLAEAGVAGPAAGSGAGESLMNKFFGPLALILALLSLVLYALLRKSIGDFQKELSGRIDKRRDEIMALQTTPGSGSKAAERFSATQLRELEQLVQQRVEEELQKRQQQPSAPVTPTAPVATVPPASTFSPQAAPAMVAAPAANPSAAIVPPVTYAAPELPVAPTPAVVPAPTAPALEQSAELPVVLPSSEPAATSYDEFDSLVPPVQLPVPPVAAASQPRTRYVKVPVNGTFSEYDFSDEPQHDSIYEIHQDPQWPELATFSVTPNPAVHAYAIQSAQYSLREACRYQQPAGPVTRIVTEEEGVLRKVAGSWQIEQKAAIRFE